MNWKTHGMKYSSDNAGPYTHGNVRWATRKEQSRNRRVTRKWTHNGETLSLGEWAERTGIPYSALAHRWQSHWDPSIAVTLPSRQAAR